MSWSISGIQTTPGTLADDLAEARRAAIEANQLQGCLPEALVACDAAIRAAAIVANAITGGAGVPVMVSISGHANPDNEPQEGWSNDTITVNVVQDSSAR